VYTYLLCAEYVSVTCERAMRPSQYTQAASTPVTTEASGLVYTAINCITADWWQTYLVHQRQFTASAATVAVQPRKSVCLTAERVIAVQKMARRFGRQANQE